MKELLSIVDYSTSEPTISSVFQNTIFNNYDWSSTMFASGTNLAWGVDFYDGYTVNGYKSSNNYVRCVRS